MSTKTKKKLTLPKGLPTLPPIPKGFDAWEYMGKGPLKVDLIKEYASCVGQEGISWISPGVNQWDGGGSGYYIRAIKRRAPAKKQPKAKSVKARRMWCDTRGLKQSWSEIHFLDAQEHPRNPDTSTLVAVLDISNPDALVEQSANAIAEYNTAPGKEVVRVACDVAIAKLVLKSLGIIPKRKGAK